ncbi:hypothetical protein YC2023_050577 [Brassica napus]
MRLRNLLIRFESFGYTTSCIVFIGTYVESMVKYWFEDMRRNYTLAGRNGLLAMFNPEFIKSDTSAGTWVPPLKKNVETWVIGFICILGLCTFLSWASRARYRPYGGRLWQIRVVVFLRLRAEGASSSRVHFCYSIIMNLHMISADIANHLPATDSPASYISRLSMTLCCLQLLDFSSKGICILVILSYYLLKQFDFSHCQKPYYVIYTFDYKFLNIC